MLLLYGCVNHSSNHSVSVTLISHHGYVSTSTHISTYCTTTSKYRSTINTQQRYSNYSHSARQQQQQQDTASCISNNTWYICIYYYRNRNNEESSSQTTCT